MRARWLWLLPGALAACGGPDAPAETAGPPPVGHYEGSLTLPGQPEVRAALDIRHPRRGHYAAELTAPTMPALSFVGDTVLFAHSQLQLTRPGLLNQQLRLRQEGDFWRGTLQLDSAVATVVLVKRGLPAPNTYAVEELPRPGGPAWRYVPADTRTLGAALVLLPDAATAPAAPLWADALAREGMAVLTLPAADTATASGEAGRLRTALQLLRSTPGVDTANVGVWAAGRRAAVLPTALQQFGALRVNFLILQNADPAPADRLAFQALKARKMPILSLYSGPLAAAAAQRLRSLLPNARNTRTYRNAGPDLLAGSGPVPQFAPGLPADVLHWLQGE